MFLLVFSACTNNRGVVDRPAFTARNTDALEIDKIESSDTAIVLHIKAFYTPHNWIKISSSSFLIDNKGTQYPIRATEGIALDEKFYMPDSGESEFTMIFPPVSATATWVDFSEGDFEGAFKIWGIQLTNKPPKLHLPKGLKLKSIDKTTTLPPVELKSGKAHLKGQILGYRLGMPDVSVRIFYPLDYSPAEFTCPVDEKGQFTGDFDALSVHPVSVLWMGRSVECYIAPGETTLLVLNPAEISRQESRLANNTPPLGEPVYYNGYLASLSKELASVQTTFSLRKIEDYGGLLSFLKTLQPNKTPEEVKTFFLNEYQEKRAQLDTLPISPACRQILQCSTDLFYASAITDISSWVDRAYLYNHQLLDDMEAISNYLATRKFNVPDNFYGVLKDFPFLNDSSLLYIPETANYAYGWQNPEMQPPLSRILGTDQGILFDLVKLAGICPAIREFKPADPAQMEQIPPVFREFIEQRNNELLERIEANKKKGGYAVTDVDHLPPAEVFPFILSKFRGKPILLDIWATWCGPCRVANEELKPVKAELAGKDIVYVFVAGENSPLEIWSNMIADLPGEHFRLSDKQWNYIGKTFNIRGVPTYFFIDREGNTREQLTGYPGISKMKEKILQLLNE
jgi:thiol-disulfide isomerase/thioredoxin